MVSSALLVKFRSCCHSASRVDLRSPTRLRCPLEKLSPLQTKHDQCLTTQSVFPFFFCSQVRYIFWFLFFFFSCIATLNQLSYRVNRYLAQNYTHQRNFFCFFSTEDTIWTGKWWAHWNVLRTQIVHRLMSPGRFFSKKQSCRKWLGFGICPND